MNAPTVIFAIAPLAVAGVVVVAGILGGVFAIFRKKKALPPGIDDGGKAAAPFLNMESGVTTAMLEYADGLYRWSIAGGVPSNGSDADAGKAAMAMAQALSVSEEDAPVTGSAGGPSSTTVEFGVEPEGDEDWSWSVTAKSKLPAMNPGVPVPPIMLKSGSALSRAIGIISALAEVSNHMDWLDIAPPIDGGGIDGTSEPPKEVHGIVVSPDQMTVAITDLAQWIAFAAPHARELIDSGKTADEIMDETIGDLPDGAKLNGVPIEDVRARVTKLLAAIHGDHYVETASPDDELAATIVGAEYRPEQWWVTAYRQHVMLVRPVAVGNGGGNGGFALPGASGRWEYLIWAGGSRGYDDATTERALAPVGKNRNNTIKYAKHRIDLGFAPPEADDDVDIVPVQGFLHLPSQTSNGYLPDPVKIDISATWSKEKSTDVELFDFKDGDFAKFKHWRIVVGMCLTLRDDPLYPFGVLSNEISTKDECDKCRIMNSSAINGKIGPPPPIDWNMFVGPLAWKGQFEGMVHRGPKIGVTPFENITGGDAGEQVDPCASVEAQWPIPVDGTRFWVQPVGSIEFREWHPLPLVKLHTKSTRVLAQVSLVGLPVFVKDAHGTSQAQTGIFTNYRLTVQVWAAGTNQE